MARAALGVVGLLMLYQRGAMAVVNGVSTFTFSGTVIDTSAWELFTAAGSSITQNDELLFSVATGDSADITTRQVQVGIGGGARVSFTPMAVPPSSSFGKAYLLLTTNSAGSTKNVWADSYNTGFEIGFSPSSMDFLAGVHWQPPLQGGQIGYGQNFLHMAGNWMNNPFSVQISRTGSTDAAFMVFNQQGVLLKSINFGISNLNGPTPSDLYVTLVGYGTVSFDNLSVGALVPEPVNLAGLFSCACVMFHRRKR